MARSISAPTLAPTRLRAFALAAAVFIFFFSAYTFTASADIAGTGDTTIRQELTENILGRLSVDLHGWKLVYYNHIKQEFRDPRVDLGRGGKTYTTYLLGQPLAMIPFHQLGQVVAIHERWPYAPPIAFFSHLVGPLFGALEVLVFFLFAVRLGYGLKRSLLLTVILAFATSVWPDEQSVLEHTEVAFSLLLCFYFAFRFREQDRGGVYLIWSGLALGVATITRYQDAFLCAVAVFAYLMWPHGRWTSVRGRVLQLLLFGIGLLPSLAVDLWYNWFRFGSLTATGHHEKLFGYPIQWGIAGLTVSPGKGLLWYCPTIFLLLLAGPRFFRHRQAMSVAIVVLVAGFLALYGRVTFWHGDPAWGPRYIFPLVPFLTLPLGVLLKAQRRRVLIQGAMAVIVMISLVIQISAVSVSQWRSWYRVIQYEENLGYSWSWIAARYRYFWDPHESPLLFQLHGLYNMTYDTVFHSSKYEIVPPDEDWVLDGLATNYFINQWNFWWSANEFNWWMGEDKVILGVVMLLSVMAASGTYIGAEALGLLESEAEKVGPKPIPEAA